MLFAWGKPAHGVAIFVLLVMQLAMMDYFLASVSKRALWYSGFGVPLFVSGMMVSAFALRGLLGAAT
jgi:chlorophyll synthase